MWQEKRRDQIIPTNTLSAANPHVESHVDVGIIVALKEEFRELHRELPSPHAIKDETTGASDYLFMRDVGEGLAYACAATFVGIAGPTEAALATERFINRRQPKTIVMLGIAAGIDDDVKLGDVVISTQVGRYLDRAKIESGKGTFDIKPGGDSFPCSGELVRAAQDLEFSHERQHTAWQDSASDRLRELVAGEARAKLIEKDWIAEKPNFLEGPVASGPVVAAAEEFIEWVKSLNRQYLALEMEGGGMLAAVYSRSDPTRTMMLRGISDFGDKRKKQLDAIGNGGLRCYATRNAVSLLWRMMEAQILPHVQKTATL
ncbi:MAG: hypothetical protein IH991_25865 [Planctomycetes bacterium]|nr:hypothetical protein [Planctomycetota bacterium]